MPEDRASSFERHGQTLLVMLIAGLMGWVGWTTLDNSKQLAQIGEIVRAATEDRYRATDADADFRLRDTIIRANTAAIESLGDDVDELERWVRDELARIRAGQ